MAQHIKTGDQGEDAAIEYLITNGYEIVDRNYRASHAEIDIIAKKEGILIFVEVKTRAYEFYGRPEEFVTNKKQQLIAFAANRYMEENNYEWEIRFDIIAIIMINGNVKTMNHFKDAFFPGI